MHVTVFRSLLQRMVYYACSLYGSPDTPPLFRIIETRKATADRKPRARVRELPRTRRTPRAGQKQCKVQSDH
jgi:hypothetical protein